MPGSVQHFWQSPYIDWHIDVPDERDILLFRICNARIKAKVSAIVEAIGLLSGLEPQALSAGPGAGEKGIFWISIPHQYLSLAQQRLPFLGYSNLVKVALPPNRVAYPHPGDQEIQWKKETLILRNLYEEDTAALRAAAPDKRTFILRLPDGTLQPTPGYRGDGNEISRRGLPVVDARLLVNLVRNPEDGQSCLEPFGGVGGVVLAGVSAGYQVFSSDLDCKLMNGLMAISNDHVVGNAVFLPYRNHSIDSIATEPPFHPQVHDEIIVSLVEFFRVLKPGGKAAMLCAAWQAEDVDAEVLRLGGKVYLSEMINRKGTDCYMVAWHV
ncbi:MAG: hypothetical protein JXA19_05070 [Anaerolineales bacterium]|nr:hypothetical protein [Anaerolineales bacterium]